jgi:hypothetical protein
MTIPWEVYGIFVEASAAIIHRVGVRTDTFVWEKIGHVIHDRIWNQMVVAMLHQDLRVT